jgi:hypothetical protein
MLRSIRNIESRRDNWDREERETTNEMDSRLGIGLEENEDKMGGVGTAK